MKPINPTMALQDFAARYVTQVDAAKALGITPQYFSDLMHGRRDVTDSILKKLGLRRIVVERENK